MLPKYRQLAGQLRDGILSGAPDGGRLPSERELARIHKVSRQTVRQALSLLAAEGILEKKRGSGSYAVLGTGKNRGRIAFLLPGGRTYLPEPVVQEIESVCGAQGYEVRFYSTGGRISREREILRSLLQDPASGVCVAGTRTALPNPNIDLYRHLKSAGTALVFDGSLYRGLEDLPFVSMDNTAGGHLAVRYLMSRGHTRIACLFEGEDMQDLERYDGCVRAIRDQGLVMDEDCYLWLYGQGNQNGMLPGSFWLQAALRISTSCSAAICRDGGTARLLAGALEELGRKMPEDFELLCFRDDAGMEEERISFSSLVCTGQHPARVAIDCLLRALAGKNIPPVRLNWRLEPAAVSVAGMDV